MAPGDDGEPSIVAVATSADGEPFALLDRALRDSGFWGLLTRATERSKKIKSAFSILIKPDVDFLASDRPSCTDPRLVEYLIDLLHEQGWSRLAVGVMPDPIFRLVQNRDPLTLADLAGYRFATEGGHGYLVDDLASHWTSIESVGKPAGMACRAASAWLEADFRICMPRFRTDAGVGYKLALNSLVGLLELDVDGLGARPFEAGDEIVRVLRCIPPHFVLLDALNSCLGDDGMLRPVVSPTRTILAGADPVLVDWTGAIKGGASPAASPLMRAAQRAIARSEAVTIVGDIRPFAIDRIDGHRGTPDPPIHDEWFTQLARLLTSDLDFELFPADSLFLADLAGRLKLLAAAMPAPLFVATIQGIGRLCDRGLFLYRRFLDPDRLTRLHFGLNVSPEAVGAQEFEALTRVTEPLKSRLDALAAETAVERLESTPEGDFVAIHIRELAIDYADFIALVDLACSMTYLNGYLGGSAIEIQTDRRGRIVRQLERTVYLSQPPFLSWFGSDSIDVTKIEELKRSDGQETICWHTLKSENQSALTDDGVIAIRRRPDNMLRVEIAVRQRLAVPAALRFMETQPFDAVRMSLARDGYQAFFRNTIANLEAVYEGRDPLIGRFPMAKGSGAEIAWLEQFVARNLAWLAGAAGPLLESVQRGQAPRIVTPDGSPYQKEIDQNGFRHFRAGKDVRT